MSKKSRLHHCEIPFAQIPWQLIRNPDISCSAKSVYCYLASRPKDWVLRVSEIQKHMKEGRDRIKKSIRELCDFGYLIKEQSRTEGQFSTTIYKLQHSPLTEMPSTVLPLTANQSLQKIDNTNIDNTETPIAPQGGFDYSEEFEEFWSLYPANGRGKGSKQQASKKYKKARKETNHDKIIKAVAAYKRYLLADGNRYNKDASSWLHNGLYKEDWSEAIKEASGVRVKSARRGDNVSSGGVVEAALRIIDRNQADCDRGARLLQNDYGGFTQ